MEFGVIMVMLSNGLLYLFAMILKIHHVKTHSPTNLIVRSKCKQAYSGLNVGECVF